MRQGRRLNTMKPAIYGLTVLFPLLTGSTAFVLPSPALSREIATPRHLQAHQGEEISNNKNAGGMERRAIFQSAVKVLGALAFGSFVPVSSAFAASPVISEIKIRESVKGLTDSVEALELYKDFVTQKDFYGIKKSLRVPPVSEIRRDCRRIIAGLDGQIKGDTDQAYNKFIENLEQVDLIATRAIQNDNQIKDEDLKSLESKYGQTQVHLNELLDLVKTTRYATEPVKVRLETEVQ